MKVEPSAARKRKPGPASAWRAELKRWKTASNASGQSLARCWLKAEADDEPVGPHFSGTGEIPAGTGRILGDVGYDMADGVSKSSFDVFM